MFYSGIIKVILYFGGFTNMKRVLKKIIVILGIVSILLGILGTLAFLKFGTECTMFYAFGFTMGGILLPDTLIAFFEDDEKDEDE